MGVGDAVTRGDEAFSFVESPGCDVVGHDV